MSRGQAVDGGSEPAEHVLHFPEAADHRPVAVKPGLLPPLVAHGVVPREVSAPEYLAGPGEVSAEAILPAGDGLGLGVEVGWGVEIGNGDAVHRVGEGLV